MPKTSRMPKRAYEDDDYLADIAALYGDDAMNLFVNPKKRHETTAALAKNVNLTPEQLEDIIKATRPQVQLPYPNFGAAPPPPVPPRPARAAPPVPPRPARAAPALISVGKLAVPAVHDASGKVIQPAISGSDVVKSSIPYACSRQKDARGARQADFVYTNRQMRDQIRAQNGIPRDLTCARSRTTQFKLEQRGETNVQLAKESPACALRDMVDAQAARAASAVATGGYHRNLASSGIPLRLRCKDNSLNVGMKNAFRQARYKGSSA